MYADLGHFRKNPIRFAWIMVAFPSLVLNYFGQCALLLDDPTKRSNPFFLMIPEMVFWPVFVLATVATVIASQALISGSFSLISQAIALGFFPRTKIYHTSSSSYGQVYIPLVNWSIAVLCIAFVLIFQTSKNLAAMYGLAVAANMVGTSLVLMLVMHHVWLWHWWSITFYATTILIIDFCLLIASMEKMASYAWVSLLLGAFFSMIMLVWTDCRDELALRTPSTTNLRLLVNGWTEESQVTVINTVGVFLDNLAGEGAPQVLAQLLQTLHVFPEIIVILHVHFLHIPFVPRAEQVLYERVSERVHHITFFVGFADPKPNILEVYQRTASDFAISGSVQRSVSFFLGGRDVVVRKGATHFVRCKWKIFEVLQSNQLPAFRFFYLPTQLTIRLGQIIEVW
eukprot:c8604_g1_i1.p1 GENE.c8604_g1_i1~~c8604_g1_i1.p1  ORF type:complete len:399 (-),score=61.55 c8604_g1_i1:40-1236(-)